MKICWFCVSGSVQGELYVRSLRFLLSNIASQTKPKNRFVKIDFKLILPRYKKKKNKKEYYDIIVIIS